MNCDVARALFLAGDAGQDELDHLAACSECRQEWESLDDSRRTLDDPAFWEVPSANLEDRVVAMIAGPGQAANPGLLSAGRSWRWAAAASTIAALIAVTAWVGLRSPGPDWEVALPGTSEAPAAVGVVRGWNEPGGTRLVVDIEGLPPAPEGSVYEFWFSRGERHISAGTFNAADQVELWVGVSRSEYPRLWITLEPLDDDESLSGINVMDTA